MEPTNEQTPQPPRTIRETLEAIANAFEAGDYQSLEDDRMIAAALQGLILLRIAESLEKIETYLRPHHVEPLQLQPEPPIPQRCPFCNGTGLKPVTDALGSYCSCKTGRALERMNRTENV